MNEPLVLAELGVIAGSNKVMRDNPTWTPTPHRSGVRLRLVCPLWLTDGRMPSGLRLELTGPVSVPNQRPLIDMAAAMFATAAGRTWHLGRIEFDPSGPGPHHLNRHKRPGVPPQITGPHVHPFAENAAIGLDALSPEGNLPLGVALGGSIVRFSDVLQAMRTHFAVPDLWLEEPQWLRRIV
jgi:hypothetical protein